uniref:Uncharacterized protein n=1 Tax=viral metagenome TaxID=1070528 RepID=A0A6M3LZC9_9ZZZZ
MAIKTFYSSPADNNRKTDVIPGTGDWYIQELLYIGSGVYANASAGTSTLTPATSPAWTDGELVSTVAQNLIIYDANSKACAGKVTSNGATFVQFNETAMLLEEDETTAATLTPGATYNFYVLTPSAVTGQTYGPYFGYAEGVDVAVTDEIMKFYSGFPERQEFSDLKRREGTITGGHVNLANVDIAKAILGGIAYGKNTTGYESIGVGSSPTRGTYRLAIKQQDRNADTNWMIIRQVQFSSNGSIMGDAASGHKMINFNGDILADGFYPVGADLIWKKRIIA